MFVSLFDLFKIGIGPSSSHTVGPMVAARRFLGSVEEGAGLAQVVEVRVEVFGSLALTGIGHSTDKALLLGLSGAEPASVAPEAADATVAAITRERRLRLLGDREIPFDPDKQILFRRRKNLPQHPNGMRFSAFDADGAVLLERAYYSIGGGFVVDESEAGQVDTAATGSAVTVPYPYASAAELLEYGQRHDLSIPQVMRANERVLRSDAEIDAGIDGIWAAMSACIDRGCRGSGELPGQLRVARRAGGLFEKLSGRDEAMMEPIAVLDWVNLWAIAVNEENAAGGRVVTAPTNGAAGIIPAVLRYYEGYCRGANRAGIHDFFLTAAAVGSLYKRNASISGAEVGCQGEVGVACSMAAAGLTAALGGSNAQIENAAEIGMEHNLGLTCDPIGGLVQIPCIERNAMGAVKAIDASRIAMLGDGTHRVSLDRVIKTMRETGADMRSKYKETSKGGLAVNVTEC